MAPRAVVLDFDGVVLDSVGVKTDAFRRLFEPEGPAACTRVVAYHEANGGLSRFEKFRWAYREVLRRPLTPEAEAALGERFNSLVEEAVLAAPLIPGAEAFLETWSARLPLFVASGTPEEELQRIALRRGLSRHFRAVRGSPDRKADILRECARGLGLAPADLAMVGDAVNDLEAARAAGTAFVGVAARDGRHAFPPGTAVLADLRGLAAALGLT